MSRMDRLERIAKAHGEELRAFCERWHIGELSLFGSVLRDDFRPESDIDVLVAFAPEHPWSVLDHMDMERELSDLLGRRVEITSRAAVEQSPNPLRRQEILSSARPLYAA